MSNSDKNKNVLSLNKGEAEKLFQIYMRVQSGDKIALNELFKSVDSKQISKADEINKKYRMSHMDNVLDSELVLDNEKNKQEEEWIDSVNSNVTFQFLCLNKMLYKKKKKFLSKAKNTGYENRQKIKNSSHSKFYEGEYDVSDFNELVYETVIEIFNKKTDENNYLTLDGKKNVKNPICDGISLLKNISYFTSRKINKRAKTSYLDIFDTESWSGETDEEDPLATNSRFDEYVVKKFYESKSRPSRLAIYAEYLDWLQKYDVHKLFKTNACDIKAIIETIMNCEDTFIADAAGDMETGLGMHLVKQETLQEIIKCRHNINIEQGNLSKDLEIIEQRLLDFLFYAFNYRIEKAEKSKGIYEKESERFLYELEKKAYVKIFSRTSYKIYDESINFINSNINSNELDNYFGVIKKYEDMVIDIVSLEKGKKKYDMVNLILENNDLVDDKKEALINIANTIVSSYQKKEDGYKEDKLKGYKLKGFADWENSFWEAELENEVLKIQLWSNRKVKKPISHKIKKEKIIVYCGYTNFYFCDKERKVCYRVPKNRRIISRSNKKHDIFIYNAS